MTVFLLLSSGVNAAEDWVQSVNHAVNSFMAPITEVVEEIVFYSFQIYGVRVPLVLVWLIFGALFFTIKFKFFNLRGFKHAVRLVSGKYDDLPGFIDEKIEHSLQKGVAGSPKLSDKKDQVKHGQVSHFQALTTALSGTVGLGNISGVAIAIAAGGPGATFWMIVAGLLGMTTKFVECTLGVKYREVNKDGSVSGGPMYYLSKGLAQKKMPVIGKILAVFFAVMCVGGSLGGGNMYQVNQARAQFASLSIFEGTIIQSGAGSVFFGLFMAAAVAVVIIGGIKSIAKVTDKIVPVMCGVYVLFALTILGVYYAEIPAAFGKIFFGAFTMKAGFGGLLGVMVQGFKRAAFSNEAGIGSAAIAHAAVQTDKPVTEGIVALLEPFIDTVVICTMTALVIIITGAYNGSSEGVEMTADAFKNVFGDGANIILTVAVVLFAFSTMISWSYYGLKAWTYLFGEKRWIELLYKFFFCLFVVIGAILSLGKVVGFSDAMIFAMCFPNIIGLYILSPVVQKELKAFLRLVKK